MTKPKRFIIVAHPSKEHATDIAQRTAMYLRSKGKIIAEPHEDADMVIAVGGDGFMMSTAAEFSSAGIPTIGINAGDLGFLTSMESRGDELPQKDLDRLCAGDYVLSKRLGLELEQSDGIKYGPYANDIVVRHTLSVAKFTVKLISSLEEVTIYNAISADGIIVSTSTGSTAYNLAAMGPILFPSMSNVVLTVLSPSDVSTRPIVFDSLANGAEIRISVEDSKSGEKVPLNADSTRFPGMGEGEEIIIRKDATPILFASFGLDRFVNALRGKKGFRRA